MNLLDELESTVTMKQTKGYKDEPTGQAAAKEAVKEVNDAILGGADVQDEPEEKKRKFPFPMKGGDGEESGGIDKKKMIIIGAIIVGIIVFAVGFYFIYSAVTADKGADFMQELEGDNPPAAAFTYNMDERALLRDNGYTADDIERYEVEERNPSDLVREAAERRKAINDAEILPYLDGASDAFKRLQSLTWLGTGDMSPLILTTLDGSYERMFGTYNCDYVKVPAMGSQLFIRLELSEFGEFVFMSMTPERYVELPDSGNIVITMDYNSYPDGSILVTSVYEKDIKE